MNREVGLMSTESSSSGYMRKSSSTNWLYELEECKVETTIWTAEENKRFENALALFDKDTPDRWHKVAAMIPGKTVNDVIKQYMELVEDVCDIEAGLVPTPSYTNTNSNSFTLDWSNNQAYDSFRRNSSTRTSSDHERKKGVPWTEEEHRQFLLGLNKYGKGDWRNISRNFVTSRTPTQVASHAQKYFIRQLSGGKDKRRSSIHDITTVNLNENKLLSEDKDRDQSPDKLNMIAQTQPNLDINGIIQETYGSNLMNGEAIIGFNATNTSLVSNFQASPSFGLNLHENHMERINLYEMRLQNQDSIFEMHPNGHH